MIFSTIKTASKVVSIAVAAKTGYELYKKGKVVYKAYKKSKAAKNQATEFVKKVKKVLSK